MFKLHRSSRSVVTRLASFTLLLGSVLVLADNVSAAFGDTFIASPFDPAISFPGAAAVESAATDTVARAPEPLMLYVPCQTGSPVEVFDAAHPAGVGYPL